MLINFFYTLRAAKLPVSVKEYLTLLEAMKHGVIGRRSTISTTWRAPRWSRTRPTSTSSTAPSGAYFKGVELLTDFTQDRAAGVAAQEPGARTVARGEGQDREDGLGRADGNAEEALRGTEEAPRGRQQDDRHRRHQPLRRLRLQPAGHPHRPGQGPQQAARSRSGTSAPTRTTTTRKELGTRNIKVALRRLRRFAREGNELELDLDDTIHSTAANAGCWTSRWCPSATTR
jgi:uncharacterized protein with von Willebrand factor type A (vWA) domain